VAARASYIPVARADAAAARLSANLLRKAWEYADEILKSSGCNDLITQISHVSGDLVHTSQALVKFVGEGESGFMREMLDTEERKVAEARAKLQQAQDDNNHLSQAIRAAIYQMSHVRGARLYRVIAEADEAICRAKEDAELGQLEEEVDAQLTLQSDVEHKLQTLHDAVEWVKKDFRQGAEEMKDIIRSLQKITFRITAIKVSASARDMVGGEALSFVVTGVFDGQEKQLTVGWSPINTVPDFYQSVLKQVVAL